MELTSEEIARLEAMTPEEINAEVARLRAEANRKDQHANRLEDWWNQVHPVQADLRVVK